MIGAGIGGLVVALELAAQGHRVTVLERAAGPGGKMREVVVGSARVDAGPTVLTMRWVFDEVCAAAGIRLDEHLRLEQAAILGRHVWDDGASLDLHADAQRSADGIGRLAGSAEAGRYLEFCARARRIHDTLLKPFLRAPRPSLPALIRQTPWPDLLRISPYTSLWSALGEHFRDPRLRQLFGRYSSYCGSSPWRAPATLMLIAHVERGGVWLVDGGMHALAATLARLAGERGATFHYGTHVDQIHVANGRVTGVSCASGPGLAADTVIVNADVAAVGAGHFGTAAARAVPAPAPGTRSLSAVTWCLAANTAGLPLVRHTVFHAPESRSEFEDCFRHQRLPRSPSVYLCAQDRGGADGPPSAAPERLLCVVNAPATGDRQTPDPAELDEFESRVFDRLRRAGLQLDTPSSAGVRTTPRDFAALFPATGGALYGAASHGWRAAFRRPAPRTRLPGLYLAGGSVHPGAGVPMAALSGHLAAQAVIGDYQDP